MLLVVLLSCVAAPTSETPEQLACYGWVEVLSPFEGERCFKYFAWHSHDSRFTIICKPAESVVFKCNQN